MISNELVQQLTYNTDLSHNMYMYHHGKILHIFPILPYNYRRITVKHALVILIHINFNFKMYEYIFYNNVQ